MLRIGNTDVLLSKVMEVQTTATATAPPPADHAHRPAAR